MWHLYLGMQEVSITGWKLISVGKNSCFWWNATVCVLGQQAGINQLMYQSPWSESLNSLSKAEGYIELPHFTITVLVVNMFVACILWDHAHDLYFQNMWRCVPAPPHWHCPAPPPTNSPSSRKTPPAPLLTNYPWFDVLLPFDLLILSQINSGTTKVRNSGLGPDPDLSAKSGPE